MDQTIQFYLGQKGQPLPIHGIIPNFILRKGTIGISKENKKHLSKGNCLLTIKAVKGIRPYK